MQEMGLEAVYPGPNLSRRNQEHRVYPYLLRGVTISAPNKVWGTDITYIRLARGWMYLVAVLDRYSRYVVSWELSDSLEVGFVLAAVEAGFEQARPEILNSDQGSHFTSPAYIELVEARGSASAWMGGAVPSTTSSRSGCGAREVRGGLPQGVQLSTRSPPLD